MSTPNIVRVDGVVRDYAWGSTTSIQNLLGRPVDGRPAAELWFGDHPDDPSPVPELGTTLQTLIDAAPAAALGAATVQRFGPRLPFLVKVLAADKPLSIQVHPNRQQARDGFAREKRLAPSDPKRNYRDRNHKPELLCALTPFEALCGFRPVTQTLELLDALALPRLIPLAEWLSAPKGLERAFTALLRDPDPETLAYDVADAAVRLPARFGGAARAVALAAADFPGDIGVAVSLLLNYVRLEPAEAIYLGAGTVHAYLRGSGVEIMANSDNVLRCGLTPKNIDVDEVLRITGFAELDDPRWPAQSGPGRGRFTTPAPDFALAWVNAGPEPQPLYRGLAQLVLCMAGHAEVVSADTTVPLRTGQAAFVSASAIADVRAPSGGRVFIASAALPERP